MDTITPPHPTHSKRENSKEALLRAAIVIFARDGYHAASTRAIAQAAGVNQALINYHFTNKEGLYLAVFQHIVAKIQQRLSPLSKDFERKLAASSPTMSKEERRAKYLPMLLRLSDGMITLILSEETQFWSPLIVREQQQPTAAFYCLYEGYMKHMLDLITTLIQNLHGDITKQQAKMTAITMFGQALVWRASRASALQHLQWKALGAEEIAEIRAFVRHTVTALVTAVPKTEGEPLP